VDSLFHLIYAGTFSCLFNHATASYPCFMLTINIGWEWALGIIGLLILMAWKGSARFTTLEISMEWVKRTLNELKIAFESRQSPAQKRREAPRPR
jgi:hypothetical protein